MKNLCLLLLALLGMEFSTYAQVAFVIPTASFYYDVALDEKGNSFIFGLCGRDISKHDFDRGPEEYFVEPNGTFFLASYDVRGELRFAFSLDDLSPQQLGNYSLMFPTLSLDEQSNVYISGVFSGWIDFDPGQAKYDLMTEEITIEHGFLLSYSKDGDFRFVRDLGRTNNSKIYAETSKSGNTYLTYVLNGEVSLEGKNEGSVSVGESSQYSFILAFFDNKGRLTYSHPFYKGHLSINLAARIGIDEAENVFLVNKLFRDIDLAPGQEVVDLGVDTVKEDFFYFAKYTSGGTFISAKLISNNFAEGFLGFPYEMDVSPNGDFVLSGRTAGGAVFGLENQDAQKLVFPDLFFASYSKTGEYKSSFTLGFPNSIQYDGSDASPLEVIFREDGKVVVAGFFRGNKDFDPSSGTARIADVNYNLLNAFVATYDISGNLEEILGLSSEKGESTILNADINQNNQLLISGEYSDEVDFDPSTDTLFLREYRKAPFLALWNVDRVSGLNAGFGDKTFDFEIFPNPVTDQLQISLSGQTDTIEIKLLDAQGRLVETLLEGNTILTEQLFSWSRNPIIPAGTYFVQCIGNGFSLTKPIILVK